ncbi:MAG: phosphomannomutase/phosphoglucomutase [Deltaproteobacteria bacterium]|nr:phosphomannomutase/phosphoglucomutase [Deltaproteobacteria bacterium]
MKAHVFREYDIRGIFPEELNEETVHELGRAIGTFYQDRGARKVSLGRDCRLSSPVLFEALRKGLLASGMKLVGINMVPTPVLYFSLHHLDVDGGIQITGSHNPPEFNGFKVCLGHASVYGKEIQEIRKIQQARDFQSGEGTYEEADVTAPYMEYLVGSLKSGPVRRKVVVDAGNGAASHIAPEIYQRMGFDVIPLFCEPNGHFPNHHPDPTIPENLVDLREKVSESGADLGIAFDGDADRIGVIDRKGQIIWGDRLMVLFSRDLLERHPGAKVIGEVKCSQVLFDDIEKHGGKAIMWKAGHSLIKAKMKEEDALLAGEMSGHLFFAEDYYGYDDAIYAGARLLEILSRKEGSLDALLADIPETFSTPEIRMECPEEKKFEVVKGLAEYFKKGYEVIDVDGARVLFDGGWGLIRASNTQPVLVLRFEANTRERLEAIRDIFMEKLKEYL